MDFIKIKKNLQDKTHVAHLPTRSVELVDDHRHLMKTSKSHNAVIARISPHLSQVVAWKEQELIVTVN